MALEKKAQAPVHRAFRVMGRWLENGGIIGDLYKDVGFIRFDMLISFMIHEWLYNIYILIYDS